MKTLLYFISALSVSAAVENFRISDTGSMYPALRGGELEPVDTARWQYARLQVGDIVVYRSEKHQCNIVHRVFKRLPDGWWARGDANVFPDEELVTEENFIGVLLKQHKRIRK